MYGRGYSNTFVLDFVDDKIAYKLAQYKSKWFKKENYILSRLDDTRSGLLSIIPERQAVYSNLIHTISQNDRLYIILHGNIDDSTEVFDGKNTSSVAHIARILSRLLIKPEFKINRSYENLTISLIICYGARGGMRSFAAQLQMILQKYYDIWTNIIARVDMSIIEQDKKTTMLPQNKDAYKALLDWQEKLENNIESLKLRLNAYPGSFLNMADKLSIEKAINDSTTELKKLKVEENALFSHHGDNSKKIFYWDFSGLQIMRDAYQYKREFEKRYELIQRIDAQLKKDDFLYESINQVKSLIWHVPLA